MFGTQWIYPISISIHTLWIVYDIVPCRLYRLLIRKETKPTAGGTGPTIIMNIDSIDRDNAPIWITISQFIIDRRYAHVHNDRRVLDKAMHSSIRVLEYPSTSRDSSPRGNLNLNLMHVLSLRVSEQHHGHKLTQPESHTVTAASVKLNYSWCISGLDSAMPFQLTFTDCAKDSLGIAFKTSKNGIAIGKLVPGWLVATPRNLI